MQEYFIPHFNQAFQAPLTIKGESLAFVHGLPWQRQIFLVQKGYSIGQTPKRFDGATYDFKNDILTFDDGTVEELGKPRTTDPLALQASISFGTYNSGKDLQFSMAPWPYKLVYLPYTDTHLRQYTSYSGDGGRATYDDKSYRAMCYEFSQVKDPFFYVALLDFAITGDLALLAPLTPQKRHLLLDAVGIAMAEYYAEWRVFRYYQMMMAHYRPMLVSRTGVVFDALRNSLISYEAKQVNIHERAPRNPGTFSKRRMVVTPADCMVYHNRFHATLGLKQINERLITDVLRMSYPYDWALLNARTNYDFSDNFFNMLAYLAEHPERYDAAARFSARRILLSMHQHVPLMNKAFAAYTARQ